jgi:hypothetical protein
MDANEMRRATRTTAEQEPEQPLRT